MRIHESVQGRTGSLDLIAKRWRYGRRAYLGAFFRNVKKAGGVIFNHCTHWGHQCSMTVLKVSKRCPGKKKALVL